MLRSSSEVASSKDRHTPNFCEGAVVVFTVLLLLALAASGSVDLSLPLTSYTAVIRRMTRGLRRAKSPSLVLVG